MKVLVIGAGKSGTAVSKMLERKNANVDIVSDYHDFVVASPGVKVFSELDIAFKYANFAKVVAVTGTNGKTSTVNMIHNALKLAGVKSVLCGNVGTPVSSVVDQTDAVAVVEVSSFQLEIPPRYFKPDISVILNITPDHLDRHESMEEYIICKRRIDARQWGGVHFENLSNIDAVRKVCHELGIADIIIDQAITQYQSKPQPHRIEFICEHNGIKYINDSKATNIASTLYACEKFSEPINLILGGVGKGQDFSNIREKLPSNVKEVFVIGKTDIDGIRCRDLPDAVERASRDFKGVVLLSPACASFDMFKDYEHRGKEFKKIVHKKTSEEV